MRNLKDVLRDDNTKSIIVVDDRNFLVASIATIKTKQHVIETHGNRKVVRVGTAGKTTTIQVQH